MLNVKVILKVLGILLFIEAFMLLCCAGVSLFYGEEDLWAFLWSAGVTLAAGVLGVVLGRKPGRGLGRRDGYVIVSLTWVLFSLFGMLPFLIGGYLPSAADAFFETMSGFTTTGATMFNDLDAMPHGILFWRAFTHWVGGLGIVFFTIAVLPIFGKGGIFLFGAESTGVRQEKVHPRIGVTAKWSWSIYLGLNVSAAVLLWAGGMSVFDAVCHAMAATATGGFSTHQASVAWFGSAYIEYVLAFFMFISGVNFTLLYLLFLRGRVKAFFKDIELRWYLGSVLVITVLVAGCLWWQTPMDAEEAFRRSLFQVVSVHTTTGFSSADYMTWPPFAWMLLGLAMFLGGCAGSTSGAIKSIRMVILAKVLRNEFRQRSHPNAVLPVRVNGQVLPPQARSSLLGFLALYVALVAAGWLLLSAMGVGSMESFSVVVSALGNGGLGLGLYGPAYSWASLPEAGKWLLSFLMLVGRLELFTVFLLFTPEFWKER